VGRVSLITTIKTKYEREFWTAVQSGAGLLVGLSLPVPVAFKAIAAIAVATVASFVKNLAKRHLAAKPPVPPAPKA
jgi:hypothetical protein